MSGVTILRSLAFAMVLGLPALAWADPADDDLWAGAQARIQQCRTAPITVAVVDASGRPLAGAKVSLEQTRHAFLFGCNIFAWGRLPEEKLEAAYRRRFADLLNYATLPFYWPMYEPRQGSPAHGHAAEVARWCRDRGIATKGHPLAWNFADPAWLPADAQQIRRLQMARIDDCVARFQGLIDRWDVVNEATQYDREEFARHAPKMTGMWRQAGQIEFPRECFRHARQGGPRRRW
jgi:GH35 family endo-1,4-beta-xylanase